MQWQLYNQKLKQFNKKLSLMQVLLAQLRDIRPDNPICAGPLCANLDNPGSVLGSAITTLLGIILILGGFFLLVYLLWGALDWILSGGDKEKLHKAQQKLTHAAVGMIILFSAWTLWGFLTGDVLGIIKKNNGNWSIQLPQFK